MSKLFILFQHLVPQHLLSRLAGWAARSTLPFIRGPFITLFAKKYGINMAEAANPDLKSYDSFNAFFTRALKPGVRPIAGDGEVASPADGAISQIGKIHNGRIFQAKGFEFSAEELLGDAEKAKAFENGSFATIYLSPRDYHRTHMPVTGKLNWMGYIAGKLFSVNNTTAENVPRLFARNERMNAIFDTEAGPMAYVMVGAMIVAGIETVWAGQVAPADAALLSLDYDDGVTLNKGDEVGRFMLGSTVILLFPEGAVAWREDLANNVPVRMGESLGKLLGR